MMSVIEIHKQESIIEKKLKKFLEAYLFCHFFLVISVKQVLILGINFYNASLGSSSPTC